MPHRLRSLHLPSLLPAPSFTQSVVFSPGLELVVCGLSGVPRVQCCVLVCVLAGAAWSQTCVPGLTLGAREGSTPVVRDDIRNALANFSFRYRHKQACLSAFQPAATRPHKLAPCSVTISAWAASDAVPSLTSDAQGRPLLPVHAEL